MGVPYILMLSSELEKINWSLCQLHMRSSYLGFGTGSLQRDFEDISSCISYLLANGKCRVVLMGHSTGSQNGIHYVLNQLNAEPYPLLDGAIVFNPFALVISFHSSHNSCKHLSAIASSSSSS
jgi:alpha-beta hydrolase superfamily lysophospholipase